jgi:hypothetical protein
MAGFNIVLLNLGDVADTILAKMVKSTWSQKQRSQKWAPFEYTFIYLQWADTGSTFQNFLIGIIRKNFNT